MYVEGLTDARKFMSAARHFAKSKPIIVVKAGKFGESAKAAASHTGSLTGEDVIYDKAFKRAGIAVLTRLLTCSSFSEESIRYRFFQILKDTPHETRIRYTNIDCDREIAIVPELNENGRKRILGVVRVGLEPDRKSGEIAFIVTDQWQCLGLGTKLVDYAIEICKDMNVEKLYGIMLPDNHRAINLMRKMGFKIYLDDGNVKGTLDLKKEEVWVSTEAASAADTQVVQVSPTRSPQREVEVTPSS